MPLISTYKNTFSQRLEKPGGHKCNHSGRCVAFSLAACVKLYFMKTERATGRHSNTHKLQYTIYIIQ